MKFIGRSYMKERVVSFAERHKDKVLKIHNTYIIMQGRKYTLRLYYSGRVMIGRYKKFKFDEKKIKRIL